MAHGFSRLSVSGYRRLKALDIELRQLNVLIGANGVGKSSILAVIDLLAASANGNLENAISASSGLSSLLTADGKTNDITFALRLASNPDVAPLDYQLKLAAQGYGYIISHELLAQQRDASLSVPFKYIDSAGSRIRYHYNGNFLAPDWDVKWLETSLSQAPKMYREAESFRALLADVSDIYHVLDVSARAPVRMPQTLSPAQTPGSDAEDLLSCLYTMRETTRDRFEAIEDALKVAFPTFERLEFPPQSGGLLTLGWRDRNFTRPIFANELSEGTLRFIWLATLLQSPGLPKVTLIDEPEVSLHPEMLRIVAELMREASERTQLIVATHSDRFVRFLRGDELVVCDRDDLGGMTAQRASDLDLAAWMEDYTLDQLWSMGRLGGRP